MRHSVRQDGIGAQAVEWFLRLQAPGAHGADAAEFAEWLARSPECLEEFLAVSLAWSALDMPADASFSAEALIAAARADCGIGNVVALPGRQPAQRRTESGRARLRLRAVAAAAVLLLAACGFGWICWRQVAATPVYATAAREQRTVTLADGSVVTLGPDSRMALRWTAAERRIDLPAGAVRFRVARNPRRPFIVDTAHGQAEAVGTIFDVEADPAATEVKVIEGRVVVTGPPAPDPGGNSLVPPIILSAGDYARIGAYVRAGGATAPSLIAWTAGRLLIRNAPLGAVITEVDRLQSRRLTLADSRLSQLTISGVFAPTRTGPLLRYLELYQGVRAEPAPDGSVRLFAATRRR